MEKREFPHEELIHVLLSNFFIEYVIMFYATLTFNSAYSGTWIISDTPGFYITTQIIDYRHVQLYIRWIVTAGIGEGGVGWKWS